MHLTRDSNDVFALCVIFSILAIEVLHKAFQRYKLDAALHSKLRATLAGWRPPKPFTSPPPDASHVIVQLERMPLINPKSPKTAAPRAPGAKLDLASANTYDLFKLLSTLFMVVDHYALFMPGVPWTQRAWLRVYGRFAAPGFFFLCGYSSKRFRTKTWVAALFLYVFTVLVPIGIVHSPFESILCVAVVNCVFQFLPPHRLLAHPLLSVALIPALHFGADHFRALNISYGSLPFLFAISGDLVRHKHSHRFVWVIASATSFAMSSASVFGGTPQMTYCIYALEAVNALFMIFFQIVEIKALNDLPEPLLTFVRGGIKWVSRDGLYIYIGHLLIIRLMSQSLDHSYF